MNHKRAATGILGTGLAILAVGIAASGRRAAAQAPLFSQTHPVMDWFSDHHDNNSDNNRNQDRNNDSDRNRSHDNDHQRADRERREHERALREAEERHAQWLRDHRNDRSQDRGRNDRGRSDQNRDRAYHSDNR